MLENGRRLGRAAFSMTSQLDPDAQAILEVIRATGLAPLHMLKVEEARERMRATLMTRAESPALPSVEDVSVPTPGQALRLRLYQPANGNLPVALFLHGGGWTLNDLDTHDYLCRRLAKRSGWLLASLDYRRAPEHKHPAALEDAHLAYMWLLDNAERIGCDPRRRAVVGESSGGTMTAGLTLLLRDFGAPMPTYQIMAYPIADSVDRWPSYAERGSGYILDRNQLKWFFDNYLPASQDSADQYLFHIKLGGQIDKAAPTPRVLQTHDPTQTPRHPLKRRLKPIRGPHRHRTTCRYPQPSPNASIPQRLDQRQQPGHTLRDTRPRGMVILIQRHQRQHAIHSQVIPGPIPEQLSSEHLTQPLSQHTAIHQGQIELDRNDSNTSRFESPHRTQDQLIIKQAGRKNHQPHTRKPPIRHISHRLPLDPIAPPIHSRLVTTLPMPR
jgi:acetyl esterase